MKYILYIKNNCIVRFSAYPLFLEDTFLKKIIEITAQKSFKENNDLWLNYLQSKGFIINELKMERIYLRIMERNNSPTLPLKPGIINY